MLSKLNIKTNLQYSISNSFKYSKFWISMTSTPLLNWFISLVSDKISFREGCDNLSLMNIYTSKYLTLTWNTKFKQYLYNKLYPSREICSTTFSTDFGVTFKWLRLPNCTCSFYDFTILWIIIMYRDVLR